MSMITDLFKAKPTFDQAREALAKAREALERVKEAFYDEPTKKSTEALLDAEANVKRAEAVTEIAEKREREAAERAAAEKRARDEKRLAELEASESHLGFVSAMAKIAARFVELDRAADALRLEALAVVQEGNERVREARALARALGHDGFSLVEHHEGEAVGTVGRALADARRRDGRGRTSVDHYLVPAWGG